LQFCVIKSNNMKQLLRAEEIAQLILGILALSIQPLHFSWWLWILLFLSPDISMLGYLINTKIGAILYNLFHHKLLAITILIAGYYLNENTIQFIGILLFTHSCFDRVFGYGLKFSDDFKHTHLGLIGQKEVKN
jgi:hypothetical protein